MTCPPAAPVPQLDGSHYQDVNCGPSCAAVGIDHASCGAITTTPSAMRAAGQMGTGATGFDDLKRGIAAYAPQFAAKGLNPPSLIRLGYIDLPTLTQTLVRLTALHIMATAYSVVAQHPEYRSDTYTGYHFIAARGIYRQRASDGAFLRLKPRSLPNLKPADYASLWTDVLDPLADGRWSSHLHGRAQQAPQKWPLQLFFDAGDKFYDSGATDGKAAVAVIFRAGKAGTPTP